MLNVIRCEFSNATWKYIEENRDYKVQFFLTQKSAKDDKVEFSWNFKKRLRIFAYLFSGKTMLDGTHIVCRSNRLLNNININSKT